MQIYKDYRTELYMDVLDRIQDKVRDVDNDSGVIAKMMGDEDGQAMMTVDFHLKKRQDLAYVSLTGDTVAPTVIAILMKFYSARVVPELMVYVHLDLDAQASRTAGIDKIAELIAQFITTDKVPPAHCNLEPTEVYSTELSYPFTGKTHRIPSSGVEYDLSGSPKALHIRDLDDNYVDMHYGPQS